MNRELDPQTEISTLARVTPQELPEYEQWCAQWEAEQDQDWAAKIEPPAEDRYLDSYMESRYEME